MVDQMNIVVLGGGESGVGAALLAQRYGAKVFLSDQGEIGDHQRVELEMAGIDFESGQHTWSRIFAADEVIKSPGIPDSIPLIQRLREQEVSVIGEVEFASRFTDAKTIAITGSNGKTTTAYLTHHLLKAAGKTSALVGNVGISFARHLAQEPAPEVFVIEVSSFQLDSIRTFRPQVAALLNITPDHLDRYNYEMAGYINSKMRVTRFQLPEDSFWYLQEDENIAAGMKRNRVVAAKHPVSRADLQEYGFRLDGEEVDLRETQLKGKHNALNALFAASMVKTFGATNEQIKAGLASFQPVPHRLEPVGKIDGVEYINDSKATNVDAVTYALDAMDKEIIWIAGGTDKGNDYTPLLEAARTKVKALVCLGADNTKLKAAFAALIDTIEETTTAEDAVKVARSLAREGQVVLLSPACASFDLFKNYMARGDQFRAAVQKIMNE